VKRPPFLRGRDLKKRTKCPVFLPYKCPVRFPAGFHFGDTALIRTYGIVVIPQVLRKDVVVPLGAVQLEDVF
jgi:hypothetical protein